MPVDFARRDHVAILTLNRPEALNAISAEMFDDLERHLEVIGADAEIRAVVVTGAGDRAFCAGADIGHMHAARPSEARAFAGRGHRLFLSLEALGRPVIAAINGYCLGGGCELALACDMRLASDNAQIGLPEVTLGIFPGWGGTQRLPRIVGMGHAMEMILSGRRIKADEAARTGLVNRVLPAAELLDAAVALGSDIAQRAPLAVREAKELVNLAGSVPLAAGLAHELDRFALMFDTADQREGMTAFVEKRPATFTGS
jgi:enoyl-CoA hydratase